MKKLTSADFDANFKNEYAKRDDMVLYSIREQPFKIYGLYEPQEGKFRRIPKELAESVCYGIDFHHTHTSGGRIRFSTDSEYIVLKAVYDSVNTMPHMTIAGSSSFDLYVDNHYYKTFIPHVEYDGGFANINIEGGYEAIATFDDKKMRDIVINFPLYNDVCDVFIGLQENCNLCAGKEYTHKKPVVYYGSSITQGGCASRPGNSYQAIISRHLDCDFINLGFSGNARAEKQIYEYIAKLDMSVFVYDYDHNAPTPEYLAETHSTMFKAIREANPTLPIIMITRPDESIEKEDVKKRHDIIYKTYTDAKNNGDENVYFISGQDMRNLFDSDMFTVDGTHPNDFGFFCMAQEIEKVLKNLLK